MQQKVYYRIWCKTCENFEIHEIIKNESRDKYCVKCGTNYSDVYLRDIPQQKIEVQRNRYKEQENKRNRNFYTDLFTGGSSLLDELFSAPKTIIMESDAGQKSIDDELRREHEKRLSEAREKREKKKKLQEKFKNVQRNDKCLCGSGRKYKHCCLIEILSL